jgi:hypothetical protein
MPVEKLIRDGKVAVIYSPGYGAGWSTWASGGDPEPMMFDPVLAQMILDNADENALEKVAAERYPFAYLGGLGKCRVQWLFLGESFTIAEYDGSESIRTVGNLSFRA